jgi:RES domain
VPILYAGTTRDVGLTETVWNDAPLPSDGFHLVLMESTETRRVGTLSPSAPLQMIDLTTLGLRRPGLTRLAGIDSSQIDYPITRQFAMWLYENKPDAQGIC